jgi:hypothetical protein
MGVYPVAVVIQEDTTHKITPRSNETQHTINGTLHRMNTINHNYNGSIPGKGRQVFIFTTAFRPAEGPTQSPVLLAARGGKAVEA